MSLIKSLIQRLLDSRTTPEEAGHSAMPSPNEVSLTPSVTTKEVWGDVCTGTASSDGYIRMSFSATSPEAIGSARSFGAVVFSTPQLKGDIVSVVCPVAKGKAYAMSVRNANNITCAFVKLIGAIGGGYNHIVWRALSCLRPSFNYLSRSFFEVNIPTLLINADQVPVHKARQSQETARRISWLHSQVGQSLRLAQTVRQTTHGLGLKTPPEELHTSPMQFANTKRLLSQCKKEIFLLLTSALITRTKALFCLSLLKQQNNFGTGGVTC